MAAALFRARGGFFLAMAMDRGPYVRPDECEVLPANSGGTLTGWRSGRGFSRINLDRYGRKKALSI